MAIRDDDQVGPAGSTGVQQPVDLARVDQRRVARHQQHPPVAVGDGVADSDHRGGGLTVALVVAQDGHRVAPQHRLDLVVVGHDRHRVDAPHAAERGQHVGHHRLREEMPGASS